jgi:hypothetical protein
MVKPSKGLIYTSDQIYQCMDHLFGDPTRSLRRRVVIVAYVGDDAPSLLPNPRGVEIICSPTPGATSARALARLKQDGALVRFADRLHMKLYWSEGRGCLVTSANLSKNAMGQGALSEAGVFLKDTDVTIDDVIRSLGPLRPAKKSELDALEASNREFDAAIAVTRKHRRPAITFEQWYSEFTGGAAALGVCWKIGWWTDDGGGPSNETKRRAMTLHRKPKPANFINVASGQIRKLDWVLCFRISDRTLSKFEWMLAEDIVRVPPSERRSYEADYPFQAVQYRANALLPTPPFQLDKAFCAAFRKAARDATGEFDGLMDLSDLSPDSALLAAISRHYKAV